MTLQSRPRSSSSISKTTLSSFQKKQKMSLTQTYYLAHTARAKLSKEAARADHDLRLLVGHANLLDGLMIDLAEAEREQESWFNQTVNGATSEETKHIQWTDSLPAVVEDYEEDSESDSEMDEEDEVAYATAAPIRRLVSPPAATNAMDVDSDSEEEDDDEESYEHLQLTRTPSRSSPPELLHESDSESEDDSMPPSPPAPEIKLHPFSDKQRQAALAQGKQQDSITDFYEEGFYLPQRQPVAAY